MTSQNSVCSSGRRRLLRADGGFTLLELMVALSIISIAIIALLRVVIGNINATAEARDRSIAASLAWAKLHDIEQDPTQQSSENSGNFGETEYRRFSWISAVEETEWPQLKRVAVTIAWLRGRKMKRMTFETLIRVPDSQAETTGVSPGQTPPGAAPTSLPASTSTPSAPGRNTR